MQPAGWCDCRSQKVGLHWEQVRPSTFSRQVHSSPGATLSQPENSGTTPLGWQLHSSQMGKL